MVTSFILIGSMLLAIGFAIAWVTSPAFRHRIEHPKHLFADHVRQYDEEHHQRSSKAGDE